MSNDKEMPQAGAEDLQPSDESTADVQGGKRRGLGSLDMDDMPERRR